MKNMLKKLGTKKEIIALNAALETSKIEIPKELFDETVSNPNRDDDLVKNLALKMNKLAQNYASDDNVELTLQKVLEEIKDSATYGNLSSFHNGLKWDNYVAAIVRKKLCKMGFKVKVHDIEYDTFTLISWE